MKELPHAAVIIMSDATATFTQQPWSSMFLVVRTDREPTDFASTLRRQIASVDPRWPPCP
jgi:hypothetical protein